MSTTIDILRLTEEQFIADTGVTNTQIDPALVFRESLSPSGTTAHLKAFAVQGVHREPAASSWEKQPPWPETSIDRTKDILGPVHTAILTTYMLLGQGLPAKPSAFSIRTPETPLSALSTRLFASLESESVEDGATHPAQEILRDAVLGYSRDETSRWLTELLSASDPSRRAGILQCLGRLEQPEAIQVGKRLVLNALRSADVEVRAAAISTIEQWATHDILDALRNHRETIPWLRRYVQQVLHDHGIIGPGE